MATAQETGIAGGALAAALLDFLVEKGVVTKADGNAIIERARGRVRTFTVQEQAGAFVVLNSVAAMIATRDD